MPKLTPPITITSLKALSLGKELADGGCPGLRARRNAQGVSWSLMAYDAGGARTRIDIGTWPELQTLADVLTRIELS